MTIGSRLRSISASEVQSEYNAGLAGRYKSEVTPTGSLVQGNVGSDATYELKNVLISGVTQEVPLDLSLYPALPSGHTSIGLTYDISTAATYSEAKVCFHLPFIASNTAFSKTRIDHFVGGVWQDVTNLGAFDIPNRMVCSNPMSTLSPFALVQANAPTAAGVSVSGRVLDSTGRGIRNARISVAGMGSAEPIIVVTGAGGFYTVDNLTAGQSYVMTVGSKRFQFAQPSRVITLRDSVTGIDWIAQPKK